MLTDAPAVDASDRAFLRLVHASPDAPPVADVAAAGGPVARRDLAFKATSPHLPLAPGTYAFEVRPAGSTQVLATTPPLGLAAGQISTAFVVGQLPDNTFRALVLPDNARTGGATTTPRAAPLAPADLAAGLLGPHWWLGRRNVARSVSRG